MAQSLGAHWVPAVLLNHWVQLALITPVMFYVGWPIHRTGWLALAHRSADMNSLITLGTVAAYGYSLLVTVAPGLFPADVREVYFEAVGVILTLIMLGRLLEARAKAGTGEAIRALLGLQARTARVVARRRRNRDPDRRSGRRRRDRDPPGREDPGRRHRPGGSVRGGRVHGHRGIDAGDQTRRRHRHRRDRQHHRLAAGARGQGRRGHHAGPDHPHGAAGAGLQGPDPAAGRRDLGLLRAGRHRDRDRHLRRLVRRRSGPGADPRAGVCGRRC